MSVVICFVCGMDISDINHSKYHNTYLENKTEDMCPICHYSLSDPDHDTMHEAIMQIMRESYE